MGAFDTSDLKAFAATVDAASAALAPAVRAVLVKGAVNIRKELRDDMAASESFGELAGSITFDTIEARNSIEAEIGPKKRRGSGSGRLDFGANIAYFGNSKGAGGSRRDPQEALDHEAPRFTNALGDVIGGVL